MNDIDNREIDKVVADTARNQNEWISFKDLVDKVLSELVALNGKSLNSVGQVVKRIKSKINHSNKLVIHKSHCINKQYFLNTSKKKSGIVHKDLMGNAWLEDVDGTNDYGLAFGFNKAAASIINKEDLAFSQKVDAYEYEFNEKKFLLAMDAQLTKNTLIVCAYSSAQDCLYVLNNKSAGMIYCRDVCDLSKMNDKDIIVIEHTIEDRFVYKEKIGNIADKGIEAKILSTLALDEASPEVEMEIQEQLKKINGASAKQISDVKFYSIDSAETEDIDDAIFFEKINDNKYLLSVAIADVDDLVKIGTPIDSLAMQRAETSYLRLGKRNLIDSKISSNLSSLWVGKERSALICHMELDKDGKVVSSSFENKNIISRAKLTYQNVSAFLNTLNASSFSDSYFFNGVKVSQDYKNEEISDIINSLVEFNKLFQSLPKIEQDVYYEKSTDFSLGEDGKIAYLYEINEGLSQKLVTFAMCKTNVEVAKLLGEKNTGLFRNQERLGDGLGAASEYSIANKGHIGLKESAYTHYTSPIRRYVDLVNHRLVKSMIDDSGVTYPYQTKDLEVIADILNKRAICEKQMNIRIQELFKAQWLEKQLAQNTFDSSGNVVSISNAGVTFRTKQNMDLFLPLAVLPKNFKDFVLDILPSDGSNYKLTPPKQVLLDLDKINKEFKMNTFIEDFDLFTQKKNYALSINKLCNTVRLN